MTYGGACIPRTADVPLEGHTRLFCAHLLSEQVRLFALQLCWRVCECKRELQQIHSAGGAVPLIYLGMHGVEIGSKQSE